MRAIGLAALLCGALAFVYPIWDQWAPFIRMSLQDSRLLGVLLAVVGTLTLAVHRQ